VTAQDLIGTARALVGDDKGLLAMDESTPTCNSRFAWLGIPQTLLRSVAAGDDCQVQIALALGGGVFVCPRHPATGIGDLGRQ
jgi:hypothetical protein